MLRAFPLRLVWIGVVLLSALMGSSLSRADDTVPYRHYTVEDGLPHESIRSLAEGPDGRLWIGTQSGLVVYDGHEFRRPVGLPDSLRSARVANLRASSSGTIWAGLQGEGIVGLRRGRVTEVLPWPKGANGPVRILWRRDTLLIPTTRSLWLRPPEADSLQKRPYDYPIRTGRLTAVEPPMGGGVRGADVAPDGTLWVVDEKRGLGRVSLDGSVTFVDSSLVVGTDESWREVRFTRSGNAFLVGTPGARRLDPKTGRVSIVLRRSFAAPAVYGNTLYGVWQNRVVRWTPKERTIFGPGKGLPQTPYHQVLRDAEGGLWIGTEDGLLHLPGPNVRHANRIDGVDLYWLTSFGVDATRNELWAASWGKGLFRIRPQPTHVEPHNAQRWSLSPNTQDGGLHALGDAGWVRRGSTGWRIVDGTVAAEYGVVRQNGVGYFQADDALLRVRPERSGDIGFREPPRWRPNRTRKPVFRMRPDSVEELPTDARIEREGRRMMQTSATSVDTLRRWPQEDRAFRSFTLGPNGDVFLRSRSALLRFPPATASQVDTVTTFPQYASDGGHQMQVVNGTVFVGLKRKGVLAVDLQASPPKTELVVSARGKKRLTASGDSLLFVGSADGLHVLDSRSNQIRRHLTSVDGLASQRTHAAQLFGDTLYVGHDSGLTKLPHSVLDEPPSPPTALLTQWNVQDARRPPADSTRLDAHERTVSFDFTGVHLSRGADVRYAYRLRPRDTTWTTTREAFTRYTDLGPGTFHFEVRARIEDGPVGPTARMTFTVPKIYYETAWFRVLVVVGVLALLGGAYAWRVRFLRRREKRLRRLVNENTDRLAREKQKTEEQAARLAEQADRLEALNEEKNRFFANISHELRTPLTVLLGSIEDVLDEEFGDLPRPVRQQLEIMESNTRRLHRLTEQLLDLSRLETTDPGLDLEPADLVTTLQRITRSFVPLAERRGVTLEMDASVDEHPCRVDCAKLEKIVGNLISNAVENTPEGFTVTVSFEVEDATPNGSGDGSRLDGPDHHPVSVIRVEDTGRGIPPDRQDEIFERFAHGYESRARRERTGIGLALARELTELHDGRIAVDSTPGEGSTFTVRLPLPPADADEVEDDDHSEPVINARTGSDTADRGDGAPPAHPANEGNERDPDEEARPTLLVVEDNEDVRTYLRHHLDDRYRVVEAENGVAGLEQARALEPDLVLADVMMPEMDGIELCRQIREDDTLSDIPLVMLTARAAEDDVVTALETGADAYVTKPFSIEELRARLQRLRDAAKSSGDETRSSPPWTPNVEVDSTEAAFLSRVTDTVEDSLSDSEFTVENLANEVGLSRRQLERRLKEETGMTAATFIRRYRLDVAAQLLEQEAGTVSEIAYRVGFGTPRTFRKHFRRQFDCPPSEYAEE